MKAKALVDVLEVVYRVEETPRAWLRGVMTALEPHVDAGLGVSSYFVDMSRPDSFEMLGFMANGVLGTRAGRARVQRWKRRVPVDMKRKIHFGLGCVTAQSIPQLEGDRVLAVSNSAHGFADMMGINAIDPSGRGCAMAVPLPKLVRAMPSTTRAELQYVAAHIATALRICKKLRGVRLRAIEGEAILETSGSVAHAEGRAKAPSALKALRDAAVSIDRARLRQQRISAEEVTTLWQAIIDERWTMVDTFDRDGRRFFVAHANQPQMPRQACLSAREARVVGAVSLGHTNVMIAYELGITPSSVATHIRRACQKLGVTSRAALVRAYIDQLREQ